MAPAWLRSSRKAEHPMGHLGVIFPGGKEELAAEAVQHGSKEIVTLLEGAAKQCNGSKDNFIDLATKNRCRWLKDRDYEDSCPATSIAPEIAPHSEVLSNACTHAFSE
jgi:hypothetical protein